MEYTGKRTDIVDVGGEHDYSGHEWFQDPPPKPQVSCLVRVPRHLMYPTAAPFTANVNIRARS
jgi:hypothetical protein